LLVEKQSGLEENALKPKKALISKCIDDYMEQQEKDASDSDSQSDSPEPPKKKQKRKAAPAADKKKGNPLFSVQTISGEKAPMRLKDLQCDALTTEEFMEIAPMLEVNVFGNNVSGAARVFTSNNKGWYAGGKIEVPIGDKIVWAQLGVNLSIVGSKEW